jgi:hypothetical protein
MNEPWGRFPAESAKAYAAFLQYLSMHPLNRSADKAWRRFQNQDATSTEKAPWQWGIWSSKYKWVERAKAYDDAQAEAELAQWEERRKAARLRDWEQAERLRAVVDGALPSAEQFYRRQTTTVPGVPTIVNQDGQVVRAGTPAQTIVTVAFNIVGLSKVLTDASKLQRLVLDEPTDNINNLSGAALDAALRRALEQLALDGVQHGDEAGALAGGLEPAEEFDAEDWADEGAEE